MNKFSTSLILFVLIFTLAACGGSADLNETANSAKSSNSEANTSTTSTEESDFETPLETQLMIGTVKLDETDYAVDAEQASELLPFWKALRSLGESETAAQAEIDAVISQIQDTMTSEQMDAIEAMELTMQDMSTVAEILGVEIRFGGGRFGEISPEMQETMEAARESGEFPGGGPGGGMGLGSGQGPGGGQFGGAEMDPSARETAIAERGGTRGAGLGINSQLLDAIIEFLEAKKE
jgi:hypothetical protein